MLDNFHLQYISNLHIHQCINQWLKHDSRGFIYFLTIKYFPDNILIIPFDFSNDNIKPIFIIIYFTLYLIIFLSSQNNTNNNFAF